MLSLLRAVFLACIALVAPLFSSAASAETKLPYFNEEADRAGRELEAYLKAQWPSAGDTAKGWRAKGQTAMKENDPRRATGFFASSVVLEPASAETWLSLARAYIAIRTVNDTEKSAFRRNAEASAYIAYQRSTTPPAKAAALVLLGESFAARSRWRASLDAYRESLTQQENPAIRTTYTQLVASHGFRMLDYKVDADIAQPRLCIQFSEELAKGRIDFAKFVSVNGADPAGVRVENHQLCVDELIHGRRYQIKVREGLPSAVDENLTKAIDLTVYIRDRKPSVRFSSQNYVLPRIGQQGIPVTAINTKAVKVEIYAVGDRRLAVEVLDGAFGQQLEAYRANEIKNAKGEQLWKGQMPVKSDLNEEATVAFPIDELLPNLKPGLYIMTATADDKDGKAEQETEGEDNGDYSTRATQWFVVSDLGLTAMSGMDGIHAYVRSLADARPRTDIEVRLIARNNEVLGTGKTDANGHVQFEAGLTRGQGGMAPAIVVARDTAGDYGFMDISKAAFDLSDRGVGGRLTPGPLDAHLYAERGVYRPGEKAYVTVLLRDANGKAATNVPLTIKVLRPDGVEHDRQILKDEGNGGRSFMLPIPSSGMTGTWRVYAYADPKGTTVGETAFLVEDYTPERLEMTLKPAQNVIASDTPVTVDLEGRYLYGAPASNLALEGELNIKARSAGLQGYKGYQFGLEDEKFAPQRQPLENLPQTSATGTAKIDITLPQIAQTTQLLEADLILRLREPSGRVLTRATTFDVRPDKPLIGIKQLFQGNVSDESKATPASFEIVTLDRDANSAAMKGLIWELSRLETRFQWYNRDGKWEYQHVNYSRKVSTGMLDVEAGKPAKLDVPVEWGHYRLEVIAPGKTALPASTSFYSGWYVSEAGETPDVLDVALDKPSYKPGDDVKVQISPRMAGKAMVHVVSDRLLATQMVDVPASGTTVSFKIAEDWGPGAYVLAELYRPMDTGAKRMPTRAIGVKWIGYDASPRTLGVALALPEKARPNQKLSIPVTITGMIPGEKAHITVAAVDLGILNLTGYRPPQPEQYYFGQRRLGTEIRDLYGKLIDGMQGVRGTIRSGGDGILGQGGRPLNAEPVAFFSGIVEVGTDGKAVVAFDIPAFDGTLRVMAAAWNSTKLGHGTQDIIIRDPVVVQGTPPKFLIIGDHSELHLSIANVEGQAGQFELTATGDGGVSIAAEAAKQSFTLAQTERKSFTLPLSGDSLGRASVKVAIVGPGGIAIERSYKFSIEPAAPNITRRSLQTLAVNGSLKLGSDVVADLIPGTAKVTVAAGANATLDVPGLLLSLDRYPYGCAEQTTSRALPLLYLNEVADATGLAGEKGARERIQSAIERLSLMQDASGSFSLWGGGAHDLWLTAYVTDFLARAHEKGYKVPPRMLETALDRLKNSVNNVQDFQKGGEELSYALYVLARSGRAVIGDLRYYVDEKLSTFATPLAQAQLGGALAMYGDKERAERAFASAVALLKPEPDPLSLWLRRDFGSSLRDNAATLTLISESKMSLQSVQPVLDNLTRRRSAAKYTSTQENAWMLLAAKSLIDSSRNTQLEVNGKPETGTLRRVLKPEELAQSFVLKNTTEQPISASVLVNGASATPEPSSSAGFIIERRIYTTDGKEAKFDKAKQNERFVVVLTVKETEAKLGHIVVEDRLPAGFEIENPKLMKSTDLKAFSWLEVKNEPAHTAFRDDRFTAAFSKSANDGERKSETYVMAYVIRAVSPGNYTHPGAYVEDMYRPERFARTAPGRVEISR